MNYTTIDIGSVKEAIIFRLRLAAERKGMTELSRVCGIESSNLYKILDPSSNPTMDTLLRITTALGYRLILENPHG